MAQESQRRDSARTAFMTDTCTVRTDIGCAASLQNDPQEPQYRNIVIVGKIGAGTGKATIANQILGENKFTVFPRVQSVTKLVDTRAVYNEKSESEPTRFKLSADSRPPIHWHDCHMTFMFTFKLKRITWVPSKLKF